MKNRLEKLRAKLAEKELDGVLITHGVNVRYLSGFDGGSDGYLIITNKKAVLATDSRYWEQAEREAPDFELLKINQSYTDWFSGLIDDLGVKRLGFEGSSITFNFQRDLSAALRKKKIPAKMVAVSGIVEGIRIIKEPAEIKLMKQAAQITDAVFIAVEKRIKAGLTELEVAWELEKTFHELGSEGLAFPPIVGSGPNGAMAHAKPSKRVIKNGEPVVIDMGGIYHGYKNDITRTIYIGKPTSKLIKIYNVVLKAQQTAAGQIRAGMTGKEADSIARNIIKDAGYGDAFGHSLGHGVGMEEHELPRLSQSYNEKLTDGMAFTIEPGIYITGWGGVRIEDTFLMENGRAVPLNQAPKISF